MARFRAVDRATPYLLPPSIEDWLPEDHLARFVVDIVEQLDLSALTGAYQGRGSEAFHPAMLLALLIYGYATGVYSSRAIERATYDSVAFRYLAANTHPDHDTLAHFRKRFLPEIERLFVQVLLIAQQMGVLKLGNLALDGSKVHANASKHSALSYGHIEKLEAHLQAEVAQLLALAEGADVELPEDLSLPEELARREARLQALAEAKATIEAAAQERLAREQADYAAKLKAREEKAQATGKPPRGRPPAPPTGGVRATDQVNLTDADSRIMPVSGGSFEQCYNAQAAVDVDSLLVVAARVTQAPNDKQQLAPMLERLGTLPEALGQVEALLADNGFCSAENVAACVQVGLTPLIALGREAHQVPLLERFAEPAALPADASPMQAMAHRLKTPAGRALYALRKCTVEPVFGIIKHVMGFRQLSLRGLAQAWGEWHLVTLAWNVKRLHRLVAS
jgi:transposase